MAVKRFNQPGHFRDTLFASIATETCQKTSYAGLMVYLKDREIFLRFFLKSILLCLYFEEVKRRGIASLHLL